MTNSNSNTNGQQQAATPDSTSTSLVARVRAGESDAWQRLCAVYGPLVYRWARQARLKDQDAADVGQEVFRTVAARVDDFDHDGPNATFRGWLWTIARHKIGDQLRRRAAQPEAAGGTAAYESLEQLADLGDEPSRTSDGFDAEATVLHRALAAIRMEFEETTWQAFWRVTVESHAPADVADDLEMTAAAVRQAKYRVLRRLRMECGGDAG